MRWGRGHSKMMPCVHNLPLPGIRREDTRAVTVETDNNNIQNHQGNREKYMQERKDEPKTKKKKKLTEKNEVWRATPPHWRAADVVICRLRFSISWKMPVLLKSNNKQTCREEARRWSENPYVSFRIHKYVLCDWPLNIKLALCRHRTRVTEIWARMDITGGGVMQVHMGQTGTGGQTDWPGE